MTKTKSSPTTKTLYQGREFEILRSDAPGATHCILSATDSRQPHQIMLSLKELDNLDKPMPKKKAGELWKIFYGKQEIFSSLNWKLCSDKKAEFQRMPQFQSKTLEII